MLCSHWLLLSAMATPHRSPACHHTWGLSPGAEQATRTTAQVHARLPTAAFVACIPLHICTCAYFPAGQLSSLIARHRTPCGCSQSAHQQRPQMVFMRLLVQVTTTPEGGGGGQQSRPGTVRATGAITPAQPGDNGVMDVLENTLWNRQLGVMSEEIVAALVCQIFEGEAGAHVAWHGRRGCQKLHLGCIGS